MFMHKELLHVKNMVCGRCIRVVNEDFSSLGIKVLRIDLGEVEIESEKPLDRNEISKTLALAGFELIEDKNIKLVEKIKSLIIDLIHHSSKELKGNFSDYLSKEIGKDYSSLSSLFSSVENLTIEKFIIYQKIEKVKEWLSYDEHSISEIAFKLGYSSAAHLSSQFKQVTGLTPSAFKQSKNIPRKPLDNIHP